MALVYTSFSFRFRSMKNVIFLLSLFFAFCSKEVQYTKQGLIFEQENKKTEAIYYYTLAFNENKNYTLANQRLGILLSESVHSQDIALFHLRAARESDRGNLEINLQYYDLLLINDEIDNANLLNKEIRKQFDAETYKFIDELTNCVIKKDKPEVFLKNKIDGVLKINLRKSIALCLDHANLKERMNEILENP